MFWYERIALENKGYFCVYEHVGFELKTYF